MSGDAPTLVLTPREASYRDALESVDDVIGMLPELFAECRLAAAVHGHQGELPMMGDVIDWHGFGLTIEVSARQELSENPSWMAILAEEVGEAMQEGDPVKLRAELVQVATMALRMAALCDVSS